MDTPQNFQDLVWWGFNFLWLVIVGMIGWIVNGIKLEIRDLKNEIKAERKFARWLVNVVLAMRTRCAMLHPDVPLTEMPPDISGQIFNSRSPQNDRASY